MKETMSMGLILVGFFLGSIAIAGLLWWLNYRAF